MSVRSATTRFHWESELFYLREFTSSDPSPTPVGFGVTGHKPPMAIDVISERFPPNPALSPPMHLCASIFLIFTNPVWPLVSIMNCAD